LPAQGRKIRLGRPARSLGEGDGRHDPVSLSPNVPCSGTVCFTLNPPAAR
jgi:hypothetical protein